MRKTGLRTKNTRLIRLERILRKTAVNNASPFWKMVREKLMKPRRRRVSTNLSKINRYTQEGDTVVIPGKVLSSGTLDHRVVISAYDFTAKALEKISDAKGEVIPLEELVKRSPQGKGLKLII